MFFQEELASFPFKWGKAIFQQSRRQKRLTVTPHGDTDVSKLANLSLVKTFSLISATELIHFSLPLNSAIHRMGNTPNILCPRCKEQEESQPYFIFYCKLSKITLDFISELINLKYSFNIPFKITLKTIIMGTSSQFHDGVQLTFYPHLAQRYCF